MKSKYVVAALAAAFTITASGQTTTWYGVANNALSAGVTGTTYSAVSNANWHDAYIIASDPLASDGFNASSQVRGPKVGGIGGTNAQMISVFGFDGLTITDTITSAALRLDLTIANAAPFNVYLTGISNGSNWTEGNATWNSLVTAGYLNNAATTNPVTITAGTGWKSFDITSLLQQYVAGTIDGIAMVRATPFSGGQGNQPNMVFLTSEDLTGNTPGLVVTTMPVPEPSAAVLGGLGVLTLLSRRRRNASPATQTP